MARLLPYLLPRLQSEVRLAEEVHHRVVTMVVHPDQEEVNSPVTETRALMAFRMESGDEAKECPNMPAPEEELLLEGTLSVLAEETDPTER
jgi:hypothetical protein